MDAKGKLLQDEEEYRRELGHMFLFDKVVFTGKDKCECVCPAAVKGWALFIHPYSRVGQITQPQILGLYLGSFDEYSQLV